MKRYDSAGSSVDPARASSRVSRAKNGVKAFTLRKVVDYVAADPQHNLPQALGVLDKLDVTGRSLRIAVPCTASSTIPTTTGIA